MSALSAAAQDEDGDTIKTLQARVADLEAQLYAVGAGGVGKMEQLQSVTDCHQSQPKGEQGPVGCITGTYGGYPVVRLINPALVLPFGTALYTHPQPKREPLTDAQINDHRLALPYDGEDLPDPWDFQARRESRSAHRIGDDA